MKGRFQNMDEEKFREQVRTFFKEYVSVITRTSQFALENPIEESETQRALEIFDEEIESVQLPPEIKEMFKAIMRSFYKKPDYII